VSTCVASGRLIPAQKAEGNITMLEATNPATLLST
jgi:hypothetical protein